MAEVTSVVITGNTTMGHLIMGYNCETLGVVPFIPVNIDMIHTDWQTLFGRSKPEQTRDTGNIQAKYEENM